jgi:hypothetical protein
MDTSTLDAVTPSRAFYVRRRSTVIWLICAAIAIALALADSRANWLKAPVPAGACNTLLLLLLAMGCEFVDVMLGMGYGTILSPILFVLGYPFKMIVPAIVLSQLIGDIVAIVFHHQVGNADLLRQAKSRNTGLVMGGLGMAMSIFATCVVVELPKNILSTSIAVMVLLIGVLMLFGERVRFRFRWRNIAVLSSVAAFNKAFTGGGYGPLVCGGQMLAGLDVRAAVATTALSEAIVCATTIVTYTLAGKAPPAHIAMPLIVGCLLSPPTGALALRKMSTGLAHRLVAVAIIILACLALGKVIKGV